MRRFLTTLLLLLPLVLLNAQDHIYTTDGKDLLVSIQEVTQEDVKFTMYGDSTQTPFVIPKQQIDKIVFYNGIEERFGNSGNETTIRKNDQSPPNTPDKIYTMDGKVISCEVVEKKRFGVNYIPTRSDNNYTEYLANTKIDRIEYANGEVEYISGTPKNTKTKNPKDFSYLSPHFISLNVGPAIPFGLFGSGNAGSPGNAYTGVDINFDGTYYLYRGLGFGITAGYTYNPFNDLSHRTLIQSYMSSTASNVSIDVGDWHNFYIMGGVGYYNDFNRLIFDYKGLVGAFFCNYPVANATFTDNGVTTTSRFTDNSASFIFGGQASMRYFINRKFAIKGNISMLFGNASFKGLIRKDYVDGTQVSESVAGKIGDISLSWINITVGISYTLGK